MADYCQDGSFSCQIFLIFQGFFGSFQVFKFSYYSGCSSLGALNCHMITSFKFFKLRWFELSFAFQNSSFSGIFKLRWFELSYAFQISSFSGIFKLRWFELSYAFQISSFSEVFKLRWCFG